MKRHEYRMRLDWTGNTGDGTASYASYSRNHELAGESKSAVVPGSSDRYFRGDSSRYNPEEMLVGALSSCHLLAYLHLCAVNNVVVMAYRDEASGEMVEDTDGGGHFTRVLLRPRVTVTEASDREKALHLHHEAGKLCFIARSVNFPVEHEPVITV